MSKLTRLLFISVLFLIALVTVSTASAQEYPCGNPDQTGIGVAVGQCTDASGDTCTQYNKYEYTTDEDGDGVGDQPWCSDNGGCDAPCGEDTPPPPPPPDDDDTTPPPPEAGSCTGKENLPRGSLPRVVIDQNNCSDGYKYDLTWRTSGWRGAEIRDINCRCIPESTPICPARGVACTLGGNECKAGAGCESMVCIGATSTVYGICVDASISCPKENNPCATDVECKSIVGCENFTCVGVAGRSRTCKEGTDVCYKDGISCSNDSECTSGGPACATFTCWEIGDGGKKICRTGSPPKNKTGGGIPCGSSDDPAISTAVGCIHTSPKGFVKDFLTFAVGIAGGLAFLMMLLGAFQMLTSAGNPETLQSGRERFTSAIIGLMIVIFAVLLLQIIGFGILRLPGFGE